LLPKELKKTLFGFYRNITPFTVWAGEWRDAAVVKADIVAGITVALVLIPQSMAYAQLAGLPPYYGLYASFLPVAIAALFGSSRQLATGPVAVVSLLTATAIEPLAASGSGGYFAYAVLLALMVGLVQLTLGFVRLGMMVDFLSHPVVVGFTNAAAIIIATSQLGKIFGVSVDRSEHHYEMVWQALVTGVQQMHWPTFAIAVFSLALMAALKRYWPKVPNVLVGVAAATLISWHFGFEARGGGVVGVVPQGLPSFEMPTFSLAAVQQLSGVAIAIALIGFMEAISIAKAMAASTRQRLDADQELIGQGLSNIAASVFQGYAVSGSFSRSAVNFEAKAVTGFSSIITAALVGLTLLFLTPLFYHLPQPTLAAVIILAVAGLVRIKPFRHMWRVQRHDAVVALITFAVTLFYAPHLENGILTGVLLSLGLYVYRTMRPTISILARHPDGTLRDAIVHILKVCPKIAVVRFGGPLFFANTGYFQTQILERVASHPELRFIIVDAVAMNEIDATGEEMLHQLARDLVGLHIEFLFTRVPTPVMDTFKRSGFASPEWADHFFRNRDDALEYAWHALQEQGDCECPVEGCGAGNFAGCLLQKSRRTPNTLLGIIAGQPNPPHTAD